MNDNTVLRKSKLDKAKFMKLKEKGYSQKEISEVFNVSPGTVSRWNKKLGFKGRAFTNDQFKRQVREVSNDEYKVLGEYKGHRTKVLLMHKVCGHEWKAMPNHFQQGRRCPRCAGNIKMTTSEFKRRVHDLVGNEYTVIGEYKNARSYIKMKHNKCGHEYDVFPDSFSRGVRCNECMRPYHYKGTEGYKKRIFDLVGNEYEVIGEYITIKDNVKMKHTLCGTEFNPTPENFIGNGTRCPVCTSSRGEVAISDYLRNNRIEFVHQAIFDDLKDIRHLRLDFYLPKTKHVIEYDGEQHFKPIEAWGGESFLEEVKRRDGIKNSYAKKNGLNMIRIPYWEFDNIEEILQKELVTQ